MRNLIVHIPRSNVFRFGDSNSATPVFRNLQWTVKDGENWVVVGSIPSLFKILTGTLRISPPPPPPAGLFPFLALASPPRDPYSSISLVSFANRPSASTGAFYDYTARYGALRDEDRITLRQSVFPESLRNFDGVTHDKELFSELAKKLGLTSLLDLPLIALSNGQTRRARILKALLAKPELLLLDEPLTGLDTSYRPALLALLHELHNTRSPRVIMSLRAQDPIPEWITHVAQVRDGRVVTGPREDVLAAGPPHATQTVQLGTPAAGSGSKSTARKERGGKVLMEMKNVSVQYQDRKILSNLSWEIREGERWHLQGANGSGKTTLLSILTGDHPQSYTQRPPNAILTLFSHARTRLPTVRLRTLVGTVSPELAAAFPRRSRMRVWDVVGTGFDGTFTALGCARVGVGMGMEGVLGPEQERWRMARVWEVLRRLGPRAWSRGGDDSPTTQGQSQGQWQGVPEETEREFAAREFADLGQGERAVVLLMRATVGQQPLLLLDEPWGGMEVGMVEAARAYLREEVAGLGGPEGGVREQWRHGWKGQAVVVVSHWEGEVPWNVGEGLRTFRLEEGEGRVVE